MSKIFHRPLKGIILKTKAKSDTLLCKTDLKSFRFIQRELVGFLDKLTVFINEFCMNKHFIGMYYEISLISAIWFNCLIVYNITFANIN